MKELEARGVVERNVEPGPPVRVTYALTPMGAELGPALHELKSWARNWLAHEDTQRQRTSRPVRTL
jgi:DNA-binding HxlR family transcriptional regulator